METITLKLTEIEISNLWALLNESKDPGNKEWDNSIDSICQKLFKQI